MMTITYGGVEITKYLRPLRELDRKILPEIEYQLDKVGKSDGYLVRGGSFGQRIIPMPFKITDNLLQNRRDLARVLSTREPLQLIFSDEPDKYWLALPTGDISVAEMVFQGKGQIDWIVPDGVAHAVTPRIFTNVTTPTGTANQVLDPEFQNRMKYYKPWASLLQEVYNTHNVVKGDFTDTNTIADKGEPRVLGMHVVQQPLSSARNISSLAIGSKVSAQVMARIDTAATGDTTGAKSVALVVQELEYAGGPVLAYKAVYPTSIKVGTFQALTITGYTITQAKTKALNMLMLIGDTAAVSFSMPQYNLGATLAPFSVTNNTLTDMIAVTNPGSYRSWPIIRALMNGENGLVAIANEDEGLLQFGNPDDIDTAPGVRTDKVISIPMRNNGSKFELNSPKAKPDYPNFLGDPSTPNKPGIGGIDWKANPEAATPIWPENKDAVWAGPTLYTDIPRNTANRADGTFLWRNRFDFQPTKATSGRLTFTLQNETDGSVLSAVIRDSTRSKEELIVEFSCFDRVQHRVSLDRKKWTRHFWEVSIERTGDMQVTWKFSQFKAFSGEGIEAARSEVFQATLPEISGKEIDGLCCWFQKWGDDPTNKWTTFMDWTDTKFYWTNEEVATNIPNLFDDGDLVEIDTAARKVYINGIENFQIQAIGNRWERFAVEPGTTTMLPIASTWANMYECQVELRGAYL